MGKSKTLLQKIIESPAPKSDTILIKLFRHLEGTKKPFKFKNRKAKLKNLIRKEGRFK